MSLPPIPCAFLAVVLMGRIPILPAADGASAIAPVPQAARPLPLSAVRLTGGALKQVQDLDAIFLLTLDVDRLLARFRRQAGMPSAVEGCHGWQAIATRLAAEREERRRIETMTVAFVQPGEMQPERDYHFSGDRTWTDRVLGRPCRRAHG